MAPVAGRRGGLRGGLSLSLSLYIYIYISIYKSIIYTLYVRLYYTKINTSYYIISHYVIIITFSALHVAAPTPFNKRRTELFNNLLVESEYMEGAIGLRRRAYHIVVGVQLHPHAPSWIENTAQEADRARPDAGAARQGAVSDEVIRTSD